MATDLGFVPEGTALPEPGPAPQIVPPPKEEIPKEDLGFVPEVKPNALGFLPDDQEAADNDKYGSLKQQGITALEGAAKGLVGPLATLAETKLLNVPPEDIKGRERTNPGTHAGSEIVGFGTGMLTGTGEAALLDMAGSAISRGVMKGATQGVARSGTEYVAARLAAGAAQSAAEMGLFQVGDEISKSILGDPNQSIGSVAANVGLSSLLGAVAGPVITGTGLAVQSTLNNIALRDFVDRLAFRKANVDPTEMIKHEAENVVNSFRAMGDEITGTTGLKAETISKVLPKEFTPKIIKQLSSVMEEAKSSIDEMIKSGVPDRLVSKVSNDLSALTEATSKPDALVPDVFSAINKFKEDLQGYSKGNYGPFSVKKYDEAYELVNITKRLAHSIRVGLEEPSVWGEAAQIQKDINGAWSKVLPAVKQFESAFMRDLGTGVKEISPDKFNTYMNQVSKTKSGTDRQDIVANFVKGLNHFFEKVEKTYKTAGIENPHPYPGMQMLKESLKVPSAGTKLADLWYSKVEADALGKTIGAGIGGLAGKSIGQGLAGLYIGKEVLGPVFTSVIKPVLERYPNIDVDAFHRALQIGTSIRKGDAALVNATKALFKSTGQTVPSHFMPDKKDLEKLNKEIQSFNQNPQKITELAHNTYIPGHNMAIGSVAANAAQVINTQRPTTSKALPLDPEIKPTKAQEAQFNRTLEIAQQPLMVIHHIKEGDLLPQDVAVIKSIYPEYYKKMSQEMMTALIDHTQDGGTVPYSLRQNLSLFLGQPLDSTMTPASIQAAQAVFVAQNASRQSGQIPAKNKAKMSKIGESHLTSDQAAVERQTRPS